MGCVSSALLTPDDHPDFSQLGASTTFAHHIVHLTSTTYGLLTLDPPPSKPSTTITPPTPPPAFTLSSPSQPHEVINSWELMAGLDSSIPTPPFSSPLPSISPKQNSNPNLPFLINSNQLPFTSDHPVLAPLHEFEKLCPPNGENKVVIYTTTLRGIRKTFEDCNAVRSAIQGFGVLISERDISMDRGFRDELTQLMMTETGALMTPPRVFIKGRYIGGVEEVTRIAEDGGLGILLSGLPKMRAGHNGVCDGCGGARFLPCFQCNGSCKLVTLVEEATDHTAHTPPERTLVVRCSDCNENGLVLCPICA